MIRLFQLFGLSLAMTIIWGAFFYGKNTRKQPISEILKIFGLGILSILPVYIFHEWFLDEITSYLISNLSFLGGTFMSAVLELILMLIFILLFIIIFTAIRATQLKYWYKIQWTKSFKTIYEKVYNLTPILIFLALFLLIEAAFNLSTSNSFILSVGGSTMIFAVLEEYFKYIINPFLVYKKVSTISTAMIHAMYVGLAFAFIENILFFSAFLNDPNFEQIVLFRSIFTTLMHIGASGLLGYFYGISVFGESMLANYEIEKSQYYMPKWVRGVIQKNTLFKSMSITQGFFLAALLHALFNLLLHLNFVIQAAGLSIVLCIAILALLHSRTAQIQYGIIGSKVMPAVDFERLRMQISVLEHVKEIQKNHPSQPQLKDIVKK